MEINNLFPLSDIRRPGIRKPHRSVRIDGKPPSIVSLKQTTHISLNCSLRADITLDVLSASALTDEVKLSHPPHFLSPLYSSEREL